MALLAVSLLGTAARAADPDPCSCAGDCNDNGRVTVDELITLVNITLGVAPVSACPCLPDCPEIADGSVCIQVVPPVPVGPAYNALYGCP